MAAALLLAPACAGSIDDDGSEAEAEAEVGEDTIEEQARIFRGWTRRDAGTTTKDSGVIATKDSGAQTPVPVDAATPASRDAGTTATADAGTPAATTDSGVSTSPTTPSNPTADKVWSALSVMKVVNPLNFGAKGDGKTDDLNAISATINALPAEGGIVFFPSGRSYKKTNTLQITKNHVKLWSVNRGAEIFQSTGNQKDHQALWFRNNQGVGVFGLKLRSDASARSAGLPENQISADHSTLSEIEGNDIQGSAAVGIMMFGTTESYLHGNYVHHTWADHIHHTEGASASWAWENSIFNEAPTLGDDGIACVTYGTTNPLCNDMEWWNNNMLGSGWGRGFSVIGGSNIHIHNNYALNVNGAGIIVASEPAYNSGTSHDLTIANNVVSNCSMDGHQPGVLISGFNSKAAPLTAIALSGNISVGSPAGPYRAEGSFSNVTNSGMLTASSNLPALPSRSNVKLADTSELRTRDTSHVASSFRAGLYRIHVRPAASGSGFEQRFEYVVKGTVDAVTAFTNARIAAGDRSSEQRTVNGTAYALVLTKSPVTIPSNVSAVSHRDLRTGDKSGALSWLWTRINNGSY